MKDITLKVSRIGNSRGVRIPASTLDRLGIGDTVIMEERAEGILLRPVRSGPVKLSWKQTAASMALNREDWSDLDTADSDGLVSIPWVETPGKRQIAEPSSAYKASRSSRHRKA